MRDHDISQRRACRLVGVDPKTVRRTRPPDRPEIREEMKDIAGKRRRFGYRRIGVLLERKGMIMNHKKLYRLYREEGLSVNHPNRSRKHFREKLIRCLAHDAPSYPGFGASGKPAAVQSFTSF